jgi:hypothetical protein
MIGAQSKTNLGRLLRTLTFFIFQNNSLLVSFIIYNTCLINGKNDYSALNDTLLTFGYLEVPVKNIDETLSSWSIDTYQELEWLDMGLVRNL